MTDNVQQKNEILVANVGGFVGGTLYGGATTLAVMLMATPIGWVAALVIGVGSVLTAALVSYGAKNLYTTYLNHIDITKITKVDQLCR